MKGAKYIRSWKNKQLKEKHDPVKRIQKITELKRELKMYRQFLPERNKVWKDYERAALWARIDFEAMERSIEQMMRELAELEGIENGRQS